LPTALLTGAAFAVALILLAGLIPLAALLTSLTLTSLTLTSLLAALLAALLPALLLTRLVGTLLLVLALLHGLRLLGVLHIEYSSDVWIHHYGRAARKARM
jgi:hypothetical protein